MTLYVKCTTDKYELPEAVAESTKELAKMTGKSAGSIAVMISQNRNGYYKIVVDKEDKE